MDRILRENFDAADLEFHWNDDEERDPGTQATIYATYVKEGIMSRNEVRDELGLDDIPGGEEPLVDTPNGPVPLPGSPLADQQKQEQQDQTVQSQQNALDQIKAKQPLNDNAESHQTPEKQPVGKAVKKKSIYASTSHTKA